jgi:hypothetical protein
VSSERAEARAARSRALLIGLGEGNTIIAP